MTGAELMGVVLFGITVFGTIFGVMRYQQSKFDAVHKRINEAEKSQAADRLHNSETFVTKAGMHEQHAQVLKAIESFGNRLDSRLDSMSERLDRFVENQPARRTTRG